MRKSILFRQNKLSWDSAASRSVSLQSGKTITRLGLLLSFILFLNNQQMRNFLFTSHLTSIKFFNGVFNLKYYPTLLNGQNTRVALRYPIFDLISLSWVTYLIRISAIMLFIIFFSWACNILNLWVYLYFFSVLSLNTLSIFSLFLYGIKFFTFMLVFAALCICTPVVYLFFSGLTLVLNLLYSAHIGFVFCGVFYLFFVINCANSQSITTRAAVTGTSRNFLKLFALSVIYGAILAIVLFFLICAFAALVVMMCGSNSSYFTGFMAAQQANTGFTLNFLGNPRGAYIYISLMSLFMFCKLTLLKFNFCFKTVRDYIFNSLLMTQHNIQSTCVDAQKKKLKFMGFTTVKSHNNALTRARVTFVSRVMPTLCFKVGAQQCDLFLLQQLLYKNFFFLSTLQSQKIREFPQISSTGVSNRAYSLALQNQVSIHCLSSIDAVINGKNNIILTTFTAQTRIQHIFMHTDYFSNIVHTRDTTQRLAGFLLKTTADGLHYNNISYISAITDKCTTTPLLNAPLLCNVKFSNYGIGSMLHTRLKLYPITTAVLPGSFKNYSDTMIATTALQNYHIFAVIASNLRASGGFYNTNSLSCVTPVINSGIYLPALSTADVACATTQLTSGAEACTSALLYESL